MENGVFVFPFAVGRVAWNHKPYSIKDTDRTPQEQAEITICQRRNHYVIKDVRPQQAFKLICEGRCWRAGLLKADAANLKKTSFTGSRLFALDFDSCEIPPEQMVEYCVSLEIEPNFWYWSFSQGKKTGYNYRLVWVLASEISVDEYESLYSAILKDKMFSNADKQTKDIARLWHGTRNGGTFIKETPISFDKFSIFVREDVKPRKRTRAKQDGDASGVVAETQTDFIMPKYGFNWEYYLSGVCDLWDKWRHKKYLHYSQRLLLFSELKCLKYAPHVKKTILEEIMRHYDPDLYADSKCDRAEIKYFMSGKTRTPDNKIVQWNNQEYTIAEWFNSGAYLQRDSNERRKRITRDELMVEADEKIPALLAKDGIQYIECQTEAGKTERVIKYFSTLDLTREKVIYSIPTYVLIDEFIRRLTAHGVPVDCVHCPRKIDYTPEELVYFDAGFPEAIPMTPEMLERKKELEDVANPEKKGLFIITHACLAHMRTLDASVIVIDENIEDCLIDRNTIYSTTLSGIKKFVGTAAGKREMERLIDAVDNEEPQTRIEDINVDAIFEYFDYIQMVKDPIFDTAKGVGKLRSAELLAVGRDWKGNKYLYFETASRLLRIAIEKGINVKLLTGTPKIKQLQAGLPEEIARQIDVLTLERAEPEGHIFQWLIEGASGSKSRMEKTLDFAIDELEKRGIDWTDIHLLTLKSCVEMARNKGFKIAQTIDGEDLYIENCAGIDSMKGHNLIVIGKADIPANAYLDMLHDREIDDTQRRKPRPIEDTGTETRIHGFLVRELWELQAEQIREPIEQAVGRARALWFDCNVYVFCDFPVRNATEYIKGVL